eukprot:gene6261-7442_t
MVVKVFVNHVDLFLGRALVELLTNTVVGSTVDSQDEEGEEELGDAANQSENVEEKYTVIGTLSSPDAIAPKRVDTIISAESRETLVEALSDCQYIIYDISKQAEQAEEASFAVTCLYDRLDEWQGQKTFVCLSTVLTWANSKPVDPEDEEAAFQEGDFRKRRAHKNFKAQIDAEKTVTKCGKKTQGKLRTFVVAAGLSYGMGEDTFHSLFRMAWELKVSELPIYGMPDSIVPTIHVCDLANIALHILEGHAETRYLLGIDESQNTLGEIVSSLARNMGTNKTRIVSSDEAFLEEGVSQFEHDLLTVNLRMEATSVLEMPFEWRCREGMTEHIESIIAEYKEERKLKPVKICVLGPPAAGKTSLTKMLSKMYKIPLLNEETVLSETLESLKESDLILQSSDNEEEIQQAEANRELLTEMEQTMAEEGQYDPAQILACFKRKIGSMACLNQGYVLDGFPTNDANAKELFDITEEDETGEDEDDSIALKLPEFVFALDATDEQLKERIQSLPQDEVEALKATETEFLERLQAYRDNNTEDNTVLNFFDFFEVHPQHFDGFSTTTEEMAKEIRCIIGQPHNYGPTPEEKEEMERLAVEIKARDVARAAQDLAAKEAIEQAKRKGAQAIWEAKVQQVKKQEQEALDEAALPLRTFLMRHVMPTLTEGLLEVCKVKPDDPVDYLAEYLFRNNPQIE